MSNIVPLSIPPKKLLKSITSASTSFQLNNIKSWKTDIFGAKVDLVASDFGTRSFGAFRNDTGTILEIFEFDPATIASTNITIVRRGLNFNGDLTTENSLFKLDWSANETTVQMGTDLPQLINSYSQISSGAGVPGTTPKKIGNIYVDTTNFKLYFSKGTSSSADWILTT